MAITVALTSLGCAKNQVDAETMLGLLEHDGFDITADQSAADVIIVNTCGFIRSAKEEAIAAILDAAEQKRTGCCRALIAAGCLAQRYGKDIFADMPEVDAVLGIGHIGEICAVVRRALAGERQLAEGGYFRFVPGERIVSTAPRYAYLKVADGCDNKCAYCAIPGIRGPFVSRTVEDVLAEAQRLAAMGYSEIIPIAQDTTRYGMDIYGRPRLAELLEGLSAIEGVRWIRPLYLYPDLLSYELIDAIAALPKVCNYLDLPLQHISDRVLAAMNRRGDSALIKDIITYARSKADFTLRTTMICGFPGETKAESDELVQFIRDYPFDRLGAFAYSREDDTPAADMPGQIRSSVKQARLAKLMGAQRAVSHALLQKRVGECCDVVAEGVDERGRFICRSMREAPDVDGCIFVTDARGGMDVGMYASVRITGALDHDLLGVHE